MSTPTGWEGLLDPGEEIVWQGRPDGKLVITEKSPAQMLMGVFFTGFALFWMYHAYRITSAGSFPTPARLMPLFGIPFVLVGLRMLGGDALWAAYRLRHTWYTLTDRRAFIATAVPLRPRTLKSWDIDPATTLEFDGREPGSVIFAHVEGRSGKRRRPVGFFRIPDAHQVHRQMRAIQKRQLQ